MKLPVSYRFVWLITWLGLTLSGCGGGGGAASALSETVTDAVTSAVDLTTSNLSGISVRPMLSDRSGQLAPGATPDDPATTTPQSATVTTLANQAQAVRIYTPAQIRSAYQLPALPALASSWSTLTATQQASYGAGQTIYVVAAQHNPNVLTELAAFNRQFNLPGCTTVSIPTTQSLPLAAPTSTGCQISVVYSSGSGMTSTEPAYDRDWAMEIAMDVQWAHATAPLARIILIEAPDASTTNMLNAINLANAMGPGVVSMSFGTPEGNWMSSLESAFSSANMTYVAASGDDGTNSGAMWPSVSSQVLAVGGTSLSSFTNSGRAETVWSSTGGSRSRFVVAPSYQNTSVPGLGTQAYRSVADVAFNGDPTTGQYVAVIAPGQTRVNWYSMGGTSLGTPQWAGIVAVANARRALNSQGAVGLVHNLIYPASSASGFFGNQFADITTGASGAISAGIGYDIPTGLGTPNVQSLLSLATGTAGGSGTVVATPPTLSGLNVNGVAGSALSFSVSYSATNAVTWSVSGAPSGLSVSSSTGIVSWPSPVEGNYTLTVKATDTVTNLTGQATVNIRIDAAATPTGTTIQGNAGTPLIYRLPMARRYSVSFSLSGAVPTGLTLSSNGVLSWPNPVSGTYPVTVTATDSRTNTSASAIITLQIGAAPTYNGPSISASAINGTAGSPLAAFIGITDSDPGVGRVSVNVKGAPAGMSFGGSGQGILVRWLRPVAGSYTLVITATDNLSPSHSSQASITVTIN